MSLISLEFAFGFILFLPIYWSLKNWPKLQNLLLTFASVLLLWHYTSATAVFVLIAFAIYIQISSVFLGVTNGWRMRVVWLSLGVGGAIAHLALWKYQGFFRPHAVEILHENGLNLSVSESDLILPLGISYYTFQGISYLFSIYRNEIKVAKYFNLHDLVHHFGFFLTISSGPIHRALPAKNLTGYDNQPCSAIEQISPIEKREILAPTLAITLIIFGLSKKWWLAGWLAETAVDPIFSNPDLYQSSDILAAIYGYTLQLFFDFSGYSDIVVGLAMLLGIKIPINFKAPLLAHNIREFWNRWHITLSTWIRDYIYLPLGGSRKGFIFTQVNLLIAMGLSGAWHGIGWNFLLWGLLHGIALVFLNIGDKSISAISHKKDTRNFISSTGYFGKVFSNFLTIQFVCFSFILFRTKNLGDANIILSSLVNNLHDIPSLTHSVPLLVTMILSWIFYPFIQKMPLALNATLLRTPWPLRWILVLLIFLLIILISPSGIPGFLYANF